MPHVISDDAEKFSIYKTIESKVKVPLAYTFEYVNLRNAYVMFNLDRYPAVDYNLSFTNQKFSRVYGDAALFGVKFFDMDELITQSNITPSDYETRYPLLTLNVSKQKEKLKSSVVDIQIKTNFI